MPLNATTPLTAAERDRFVQMGYHFPVPVLGATEAAHYRQRFLDYRNRNLQRLEGMSSHEQYLVFSHVHFVARWVYDLVVHPRVLDPVQAILGDNLIVWASNWFAKMPGEKTFVSWHQDGKYWNVSPDTIVTAWVAVSPSTRANGCLRVVPGTHRQRAVPHRETYNPDNALSRGQDVAVEVEESRAVDIELQAGEMSLHHLWIVHGSRPNSSPDTPRIGLAIRYVSTEVRQDSPTKPLGMLIHGRDDYGHFELLPPPTRDDLPADDPEHLAIVERIRASVMPAGKQKVGEQPVTQPTVTQRTVTQRTAS